MAESKQSNQAEGNEYEEMETRLFNAWNDAGCFKRTPGFGKHANDSYTIVIPPPNITGKLHMGHALNDSIQDACIRRARMQGYQTRWILGTDHAGIATQAKVDRALAAKGISRLEIGRDAFVKACYEWRDEYGTTIVNQIKGMGCSCDYSDEHFTLDPDYVKAVRALFVDWYHHGLIYRGKKIVNWCPHCGTAIADDEAEYVNEKGHLWYLRYPLVTPVDGHDYIVIATTRPETMLGDTGVAVSPKDPDKKKFVGAKVKLPLVDREIPIFSDYYVDPEFGTGFVKVTPSHDPNDWAMGERHDLEKINIFDGTAHVVDGYGKFSGMDRDEAREAIVAEFDKLGLLDHVEDIEHSVMTCYRCHTKLEPWESEQWFVDVDKLKGPARKAVADGETEFHPARWKKVYLDWLDNLKDWCISRQLWWGHRIPMFYCDQCGWEDASETDITTCPRCGSKVRQDEDVLDTWFSSQLWPFATMGWTTQGSDAPEIKKHYPTQVLSTARDIMGLWVARMVMASEYCIGTIPFENVIIHPTVMGSDGKPMSKSRGNGVDPMLLKKKYGVDGMRFGLLMQVTGVQDLKFNEDKLENSRNFANKIKNAAHFVLMNLDGYEPGEPTADTAVDKWILSRLAHLVKSVDAAYDAYEFSEVTRQLYAFFWNEFCDWYIEFSKSRLHGDDPKDRLACQRNLVFVLDKALRLLHPTMPFITEEIFAQLPVKGRSKFLMMCDWPDADELDRFYDPDAERPIKVATDVVSAVRATRSRYGISPKREMAISVKASDESTVALIESQRNLIAGMGNLADLDVSVSMEKPKECSVVLFPGLEVYVHLAGIVDVKAELARLKKNREKTEKDVARLEKKFANKAFLEKARPEIIEKDRKNMARLKDELSRIDEQMNDLQ